MPPAPPPLPPRMAERLEALRWPLTFGEADREIGVVRSVVNRGDRREVWTEYPEELRRWPLGEAIVDAILDTVGPHAAALLRRRVMLLPPVPKGGTRDDLVRVRRLPAPTNDAAEIDLLWVVDPVGARALLWPVTYPEAQAIPLEAEVEAARLRLVHAFDWSCSIITENGKVERTTLREPPTLVERWGEARTPAAHALVEYGRTLPREQLAFGDEPS